MSIFRGIAVTSAALMASTVVVQAADLYGHHGGRGSIKDDHSYAAPRSGCPSIYARIDGGYSGFDKPNQNQAGVDEYVYSKIDKTWNFGGGIGAYITCNVRADLTYDVRGGTDMSGFNPNPYAPNYGQMKWGYESQVIMANFYYDFNMRSRFTPYIGVGLGMAHNEFKAGSGTVGAGALEIDPITLLPVASGAIGTRTTVAGNSKWSAAGAFMTGFVFNIHDRLKLDTGYRFLYLGDAKTGQTANSFGGTGGPIHVEHMHAHEFRVGLRYDIR
jgi:opacity protein-like surface antigen